MSSRTKNFCSVCLLTLELDTLLNKSLPPLTSRPISSLCSSIPLFITTTPATRRRLGYLEKNLTLGRLSPPRINPSSHTSSINYHPFTPSPPHQPCRTRLVHIGCIAAVHNHIVDIGCSLVVAGNIERIDHIVRIHRIAVQERNQRLLG